MGQGVVGRAPAIDAAALKASRIKFLDAARASRFQPAISNRFVSAFELDEIVVEKAMTMPNNVGELVRARNRRVRQ